MASIRQRSTKTGGEYYEIRVKLAGKPEYSMRWAPHAGWSKKSINKELTTIASDFKRRCVAGEVETRKEKAAREAKEAAKAKAAQEEEARRKAEEEAGKAQAERIARADQTAPLSIIDTI